MALVALEVAQLYLHESSHRVSFFVSFGVWSLNAKREFDFFNDKN
jgi:hypothetical protein